jgi:hypothetical protein
MIIIRIYANDTANVGIFGLKDNVRLGSEADHFRGFAEVRGLEAAFCP